MGKTDKKLKCS